MSVMTQRRGAFVFANPDTQLLLPEQDDQGMLTGKVGTLSLVEADNSKSRLYVNSKGALAAQLPFCLTTGHKDGPQYPLTEMLDQATAEDVWAYWWLMLTASVSPVAGDGHRVSIELCLGWPTLRFTFMTRNKVWGADEQRTVYAILAAVFYGFARRLRPEALVDAMIVGLMHQMGGKRLATLHNDVFHVYSGQNAFAMADTPEVRGKNYRVCPSTAREGHSIAVALLGDQYNVQPVAFCGTYNPWPTHVNRLQLRPDRRRIEL